MDRLNTLLLSGLSILALSACSSIQGKTYSSNMMGSSDVEVQQAELNQTESIETGLSAGDGDIGLGSLTDPFENTNRAIFSFNRAVDNAIIFPLLRGYRTVVPQPARTGVSNFLKNLKTPVRFANQLLQADFTGAMDELTRGVVNTFVGVGGVIDIAGIEGLKGEDEDFGQTLGVWGIGHGPYVMVPFFGGASTRDLTGYGVDMYVDPVRLYLDNVDKNDVSVVRTAAGYVDFRDSLMDVLKDLEYSSVDYYASVRSSYYQRREALKYDNKVQVNVGSSISDGFDDL